MIDAVERIVNLALYFAAAAGPVTAEKVRADVPGYDPRQDDAAFARMFERDKDELRRSGLAISFDEERQVYWLDRRATYVAHVELSGEEAAAIAAAGGALVDDPSFPFASDLRLALAKISEELGTADVPTAIRLADEDPSAQASRVAALTDAARRRKLAGFGYTNSRGGQATREVEPLGLFLHDGRWYLVAREPALDELRTYAVARMSELRVSTTSPKTPDFERPDGFEVGRFVRLPFQYGRDEDSFEATIRLGAAVAWRAATLTAGQGALTDDGDGALWRIEARSRRGLLRFVVENGPGLEIVSPPDLADELTAALAEVEALHA